MVILKLTLKMYLHPILKLLVLSLQGLQWRSISCQLMLETSEEKNIFFIEEIRMPSTDTMQHHSLMLACNQALVLECHRHVILIMMKFNSFLFLPNH